jgi:hypothetical protein
MMPPMFNDPAPSPDQIRPEALVASARLWLFRVAAALIEVFEGFLSGALKRELRRQIAHAERGVEAIVFLLAMARIVKYVPPRGATRPATAPFGFRRVRTRGGEMRRFTHGAFSGARTGNLSQRVRRMLAVLANPARAIARMTKRIYRGLQRARLIAIAPPELTFASSASAPRVACADSS